MSFSNANTGSKDADPYTTKNKEQASIETKIEDLSEFISKEKFGMMTTRDGQSGALVSRCMAIAGKENGGIDLLFHTNTESGKTDDIDSDSHINISFYNGTGEWASISGRASVITDRELVRKHYSPSLKAWMGDLGDGKHDGGPEDPRIGVIRVETVTATYALARQATRAGGFVEMAKGVVTGSAPQVNKLREITQQEVATWRQSKQMVQETKQ